MAEPERQMEPIIPAAPPDPDPAAAPESARRETSAGLEAVYAEYGGDRISREDWTRLCEMGWKDKLRRLEQSFLRAWQGGANPVGELEALRSHWEEGHRIIQMKPEDATVTEAAA
jgi:hypothetical protein